MTLALLVACGIVAFYLAIIAVRLNRRRRLTPADMNRAVFAAAGLSGSCIGGGYPIFWAMGRNLIAWFETGSTKFTFTGNLPPGVDEDDMLFFLVVGMMILIGQAAAEAWRATR